MYSREIDGRTLTLHPTGWTYDSLFVLYDRETETLWYPEGDGLRGIQGPYLRARLPERASDVTTWGRWVARHRDSLILK